MFLLDVVIGVLGTTPPLQRIGRERETHLTLGTKKRSVHDHSKGSCNIRSKARIHETHTYKFILSRLQSNSSLNFLTGVLKTHLTEAFHSARNSPTCLSILLITPNARSFSSNRRCFTDFGASTKSSYYIFPIRPSSNVTGI